MDQSAVPKDLPMEQVYRIANSEAGKNLIKLLQSKNSPELSDAARLAVSGNAAQAKSQAAYIGQYNSLVERYENLQSRYDTLQQQKERRLIQADAIGGCLFALEELDLLQITFSDALWNTVVSHVTVYADDRLVFRFKNGSEITVQK